MPCVYRTIARLDCLNSHIRLLVNKLNLSSIHRRGFRTQETAEMGKDKVSYQLKTPKGTKDCTKFLSVCHLIYRLHIY